MSTGSSDLAAERRKKAEDAAGPAIPNSQKGLNAVAVARETRVVHKDGRKFLMEVDVVSPSARDIKQTSSLDKGVVTLTAMRPAPISINDAKQADQLFSEDMSPTQSRDLEQLKREIMREQQKLYSVVEQQGAVLQDMHARLQHQQLSPVKPSQLKHQPTHLRSSDLDGPAARHLKCEHSSIDRLFVESQQELSHRRYILQQEEVLLAERASERNADKVLGANAQDVFPDDSVSSQPTPSCR